MVLLCWIFYFWLFSPPMLWAVGHLWAWWNHLWPSMFHLCLWWSHPSPWWSRLSLGAFLPWLWWSGCCPSRSNLVPRSFHFDQQVPSPFWPSLWPSWNYFYCCFWPTCFGRACGIELWGLWAACWRLRSCSIASVSRPPARLVRCFIRCCWRPSDAFYLQ